MGHARAIINIEDPETQYMVFEQIMKYDFSVRKVEEIVRELMKPEEEKREKPRGNVNLSRITWSYKLIWLVILTRRLT